MSAHSNYHVHAGSQHPGVSMAISHELSSEIATALLSAKGRSPRELKDLKEIILVIHSTLQRLTDDARLARLKSHAMKRAAGQMKMTT
jgi:hypothetical protein